MRNLSLLAPSQVDEFCQNGVLVLRGFYDLDRDIKPIQRGIYEVIGQVMKRHGVADKRKPFCAENFDEGYLDLVNRNRSWCAEIYDAVKQIPSFIRLVGSPFNEQLFCEVRSGSMPGVAAGGFGIRIDNPNEERFRAPWHQEYPAQLRSLDGLVFWSPLIPVTEELGPVTICPGSHREGAVPVFTHDPNNPDKSGAYSLVLKDEEALIAKYAKVAPLTRPGDLLIIDFLTLHASGNNSGSRARWSIQFRYFNFDDPTGLGHGWKGSYAAGVDFRAVHPELCADLDH